MNFIKKDLLKLNEKNVKKVFENDYDVIINLIGYVSNQSFKNFSLKEIQKTILINSFAPLLVILPVNPVFTFSTNDPTLNISPFK